MPKKIWFLKRVIHTPKNKNKTHWEKNKSRQRKPCSKNISMWLVASKRIVTCCALHHLIDNSKVKYCAVESCFFHKIAKLFKMCMNYSKPIFLPIPEKIIWKCYRNIWWKDYTVMWWPMAGGLLSWCLKKMSNQCKLVFLIFHTLF